MNKKIETVRSPDIQQLPGRDKPIRIDYDLHPMKRYILKCPRCGSQDVTRKVISQVVPIAGDVVKAQFCVCNDLLCQHRFVITNSWQKKL